MILAKKVTLTWNTSNIKHYESKGYTYTKLGDEFEVEINDLSQTSKVLVEYKCDINEEGCKGVDFKKYILITKGRKIVNLDCCNNPKCYTEKRRISTEKKYGVSNVMMAEEVKSKYKEASLKKIWGRICYRI